MKKIALIAAALLLMFSCAGNDPIAKALKENFIAGSSSFGDVKINPKELKYKLISYEVTDTLTNRQYCNIVDRCYRYMGDEIYESEAEVDLYNKVKDLDPDAPCVLRVSHEYSFYNLFIGQELTVESNEYMTLDYKVLPDFAIKFMDEF